MNTEQIEVSLGKNGGTKVFESIQELETWFNQESAFWSWLKQQQPYSEAKQTAWNTYAQFFDGFPQHLREAKNIKRTAESTNQTPQFKDCFANIQSLFKQCYEQRRCVLSATPFAKFVSQLRSEEGDGIAAAALVYSMRVQMNLNQFENFKGAMIAFTFDAGIRERKTNESQALEEMRLDWEKKFQTFRDVLQTETDTHKKLNADGGQLISKQDATHKELLAKQETALNDLVAKAKKDWADLNKTYDDALAVRSPVNYWTKKAKSHLVMAWIYAVVSAGAAAASLCFLIPEIKSMMEIPKGIQEPDKWHPEYWRLAVLIASGLFCVWVIRILVRLLLSNIHLLTDARERVTMVQTYLALLRRGKIKDDERMFILQTLFRPTPTGIVKDDAVPLTVVEGITKLGR